MLPFQDSMVKAAVEKAEAADEDLIDADEDMELPPEGEEEEKVEDDEIEVEGHNQKP